jgi:hypothetical protein
MHAVLWRSFVGKFVSELSEWNCFVAHQHRNAFDDRIHQVAAGSRQAAVDPMFHSLPSPVPQSAAPDDRINFRNE